MEEKIEHVQENLEIIIMKIQLNWFDGPSGQVNNQHLKKILN